jgi:hypothetical protein
MRKLLFTFLIFLQFSALKAQTLIRDQQVATFNSYASSWTSDLSDFTFKVDGQGNDYIKYYNPGANYPWNGMPYWVIPDLNTAVYALGIAPWWTNEPDVLYNSVDLDFDVDSIGNKYYVFNTTPYDSASANGIMFYGGVWTFSLNTNNTLRWAKEGIGIVLPDNAGNSFYIKNDTVCKLDGSGNNVFATKVSVGTSLISSDQAGGVFIKENGQIKRLNSQGVISWARNYFACVSDPKGNLYLQVTADSTIKVDRYNNDVWKRKRNIIGHTFDYNGNSYTILGSFGNTLSKYNAWGTLIWSYCHTGSTALGLGIEANNQVHVFAGALNGEYNNYVSDLASFSYNYSAYFVQEYTGGATNPKIRVLPNHLVQEYNIYGVTELCECKLTYVPFTTECKQFNAGNVFSLWLCNATGTSSLKIADMAGTSDGVFNNVGFPSPRPGDYLKITSSSPATSSGLFYYPIISLPTYINLYSDYTYPSCDSVMLRVSFLDECYGSYMSYLKKDGLVIDSLSNSTTYYVKKSGNYSIATKTVGVSCPRETDTLSLAISQPASSSVSIVGSSTVCTGQTVNLKATVNTPMFRWERNGLYIPGSDNQQNYYASQTGFYRVYAYDSLGCNKYSAAKKATVGIGVVSISTNGSTTFCNGDSVGFGVDQLTGYTYQWKKNGVNIAGATAPMYYAKSAGIYRCMFTNAAGCTKTSNSYTVNVNCRVADGGNDNDLVVYPNPAEDWIYIDRLIENDLRIEMYNMLGKKIMDQQLTDDKINIRHLPNGIYTLRLSGDTIKIVRVEVIH